jgi:hypothetical protein
MWMPLTPTRCINRAQSLAALRLLVRDAGVAGDVEQRLLDEPRHHARVGAAAGDRGRPARILAPRGQRRFAQREVGPGRGPLGGVEIEACPGLVDRVDIERAEFAAELHDVDRRSVDREVDAKALAAALGQQRRQKLAVIVAGQRRLHEADAALVEQVLVLLDRIDDREAVLS